jgi:hypothetical protein
MDNAPISKIDAASRQLDYAIALLFAQEDAVAVQTLAGAAADIAAEGGSAAPPNDSWNIAPRDACGMNGATYTAVVQAAERLSREVARAPFSVTRFTLTDTTELLAASILAVGQQRGRLTISQSVFEFWYLSSRLNVLGPSFEFRRQIREIFGNLSRKSVKYRLAVGRSVLTEEMERINRQQLSGGRVR